MSITIKTCGCFSLALRNNEENKGKTKESESDLICDSDSL